MKINFAESAQTSSPLVIDDPSGTLEYRFKYPIELKEFTLDLSEELSLIDGSMDSTYRVGFYYRNGLDADNPQKEIWIEGMASSDIVDDDFGNGHYTDLSSMITQTDGRLTCRLKNPLWCSVVGFVCRLNENLMK